VKCHVDRRVILFWNTRFTLRDDAISYVLPTYALNLEITIQVVNVLKPTFCEHWISWIVVGIVIRIVLLRVT